MVGPVRAQITELRREVEPVTQTFSCSPEHSGVHLAGKTVEDEKSLGFRKGA